MSNFLKKTVESVGKNMKPAYPMVAVAMTNAIFKPLTTLTDKKNLRKLKNIRLYVKF